MIATLETKLGPAIKIVATILIASALGLELWNLYLLQTQGLPLQGWGWAFAFGRVALIAHGVESMIAAIYAPSRHQSSLRYGLYTFFVGTIGLLELFRLKTAD